jgi:uncharacterized protein (TIGR00730 family)
MKIQQHSKSEIKFLAGPQSRWRDFKFIVVTFFQFVRGFRILHFIGPCITFFGSARFDEDHEYYKFTRKAAGEMAKLGFTILTGGGPGLMEAANRGAKDVGGRSVGCNIKLPVEQHRNQYLDRWVSIKYFFIRKILLVKYSFAFIVMPGGFGTMDEYFEALTLMQTNIIKDFPVIVFYKDFHQELVQHMDKMVEEGTISKEDRELFLITDSLDDAVALVKEKCIKKFKLREEKKFRPAKWLFEKRFTKQS